MPDAAFAGVDTSVTPAQDSATTTDAGKDPTMVEGWLKVVPGGNTICSDGSEYSFYVRKGTVNKVVVNFEGGGACWSHGICSYPDLAYTSKIVTSALPWTGYSRASSIPGILNQTRTDSLFKDWTIVHVPYCTGDIHWGTQDKTYTDAQGMNPLVIHHRGAVNATAALNYLYANETAPEKVFVTGESAGGYGAAMWAPYVRKQYGAGTHVYELSDSSAGVLADGFFSTLQSAWNFQPTLPSFVPAFADPTKVKTIVDLFNGASAYGATTTPTLNFSMYNPAYDETQVKFYALQQSGVTPQSWSAKMREHVVTIKASAPAFRAYTAAGSVHTIMLSNTFYTDRIDGVSMHDWVAKMVNNDAYNNIDCNTTGAGCGTP